MLKNITYLSIFTTFVVLVWISLTVYHSFTASTITRDVDIQILPLSPTFNTSVIESLQAREPLPVNLSITISTSSAITAPIPSAAPSVAPAPSIKPLVKPSETPTSTPSAGIAPGF